MCMLRSKYFKTLIPNFQESLSIKTLNWVKSSILQTFSQYSSKNKCSPPEDREDFFSLFWKKNHKSNNLIPVGLNVKLAFSSDLKLTQMQLWDWLHNKHKQHGYCVTTLKNACFIEQHLREKSVLGSALSKGGFLS